MKTKTCKERKHFSQTPGYTKNVLFTDISINFIKIYVVTLALSNINAIPSDI